MSELISKAELARRGGVSRAAITKLCKDRLSEACVGSKIDANNPLVKQWLASKNAPEITAIERSEKQSQEKPNPSPESNASVNIYSSTNQNTGIKDLEDLTVREVVMRYGSIDGFKRFVESLKNIAEYKHREIRVRQQRNELIEREKVAGVVFPLIDVAFSRLVSDVPDTLAKLVIARVESGGPDTNADVVQLIRDANSQVLKNVKHNASKLDVLTDAHYR